MHESSNILPAARVAAVIWALWLFEFVLVILMPRGFLRENEIPLGARLLLLGYTTTVLIAFLSAIQMIAMLVLRLPEDRSLFRRCGIFKNYGSMARPAPFFTRRAKAQSV